MGHSSFCLHLFFLSFLRTLFALPSPYPADPFDDSNAIGSPFADEYEIDINPVDDGPTSDRSPGIGVEFEASGLIFSNSKCNEKDTFAIKGYEIEGRSGADWSLTVDTTTGVGGQLAGEYILNGKTIKIGSKRAGVAAAEIHKDIENWRQNWGDKSQVTVTVPKAKDTCRTWEIIKPKKSTGLTDLVWQRQITSPMPLAAINDLFEKAIKRKGHVLLPQTSIGPKRRMVWVNRNFFQSNPEGNKASGMSPEVLGFLSLVVSYAKHADMQRSSPTTSAKMLTPIMPRTNFATIYQDVKSGIKGDLYSLIKILTCYRNDNGDSVELDQKFCTGSVKSPKPLASIDEIMTFHMKGNGDEKPTVKEWMKGLPSGKDLMAEADAIIDKQIGALGSAKEHLYGNNQREVPLFEFRDLGSSQASDFKKVVDEAEAAIIHYHKTFKNSGSTVA